MPRPKHQTASPEVKKAFGRRLALIRESAGYSTAVAFARELGVEDATYGRWERGETEPNIFYMMKILSLANVSADYLVLGHLPPRIAPDSPAKRR